MMDKLYAINPDGTEKWSFDAGGSIESSSAIGAEGTIYFGVNLDTAGQPNFFALNPDGTIKWEYATKMHASIMASPAIGSDGTVYITSWDGNLYAFGSSSDKEVPTEQPLETEQFVPYGVNPGEWYPTDDTDCSVIDKEKCEEFFSSHPSYNASTSYDAEKPRTSETVDNLPLDEKKQEPVEKKGFFKKIIDWLMGIFSRS